MTRPLKLNSKQWELLQERLRRNHPLSVILSRDKMKRVLGFTTRYNDRFNKESYTVETDIYLDFFDESKHTMFLLKYSEYVNQDD